MGGILRVGGREFERGIGVHSEASLLYDLQGAYGRFVTSFGLDDDTGSYADVDVEIRVDGQLRFRETSVRPGTLHGPIRIDTANADRVQLSVLFGSNADIQDRFDWIEPALIR